MIKFDRRLIGALFLLSATSSCATTAAMEGELAPKAAEEKSVFQGDGPSAPVPEVAEAPDSASPRQVFVPVASLPGTEIVTTSVWRVKEGVTMNTPAGGSIVLSYADLQSPRVFALSDKAQVGCASDEKVALIERDSAHATYALVVYPADSAGALEGLMASQRRVVKTRGFVPNPGSGCAFVSAQKLIVEGTRFRDDRAPYHGIFTLTPRRLDFWTTSEGHVPHVVGALGEVSDDVSTARIVLSSAPDPKASSSGASVYALDAETETGRLLYSADYMSLVGRRDAVLTVSREGACVAMQPLEGAASPGAKSAQCLFEGAVVKHLSWVSSDSFQVELDTGKNYLVTRAAEAPRITELSPDIVVVSNLSGYDDHFVLARRLNDIQNVALLSEIAVLIE